MPSFFSGRERRISYEGEKLLFFGGNQTTAEADDAHILDGVVCSGVSAIARSQFFNVSSPALALLNETILAKSGTPDMFARPYPMGPVRGSRCSSFDIVDCIATTGQVTMRVEDLEARGTQQINCPSTFNMFKKQHQHNASFL